MLTPIFSPASPSEILSQRGVRTQVNSSKGSRNNILPQEDKYPEIIQGKAGKDLKQAESLAYVLVLLLHYPHNGLTYCSGCSCDKNHGCVPFCSLIDDVLCLFIRNNECYNLG